MKPPRINRRTGGLGLSAVLLVAIVIIAAIYLPKQKANLDHQEPVGIEAAPDTGDVPEAIEADVPERPEEQELPHRDKQADSEVQQPVAEQSTREPDETNVKPDVEQDKPDSSDREPSSGADPDAGGDTAQVKSGIDAKYAAQFNTLQSACEAKSQGLLQQIIAQVEADASLNAIQEQFLGQVAEAEAECDKSFQALLSEVQTEYKTAKLDTADMPKWQSEYENAKTAARMQALTVVLNHMQQSSDE